MKLPTKAIIPAAGLGTRFLPQTKSMPKEMLPIVDKPVIQLVVEELVGVGVQDIIIVTGPQKRSIEDHFDRDMELESSLRESGKDTFADTIREISELANFVYIRQKGEPKGNARPVLNAQHLLSPDEAFYVFFPDDFYRPNGESRAQQLLDVHMKTGKSVISLKEIHGEEFSSYGVVEIDEQDSSGELRVTSVVEKPGEANAPSNLGSVGGYLLTPNILPIIAREEVGHEDEIVLADSIRELAKTDLVYGKKIEGVYHDAGNKLKYLQAVVDVALESDEFGEDFENYLRSRLG